MKRVFPFLLIVFLIACAEQPAADEQTKQATPTIDHEKELAAIEATRAQFSLALKEGRFHDTGSSVTPDVKTIRAGGPGWDEMFALGKERGRFPYDSITMTPTETLIMNDSMAYDWGHSKVYYTNREGEVVELQNSFLVILKKQDGQWKLHREVGSPVLE